MKSLYLALTLFLASLVAANPVPNPTADPDPDPVAIQFYGASLTGVPLKRRDEEPAVLVKRTQSPTSGADANKCGTNNQVGGVSFTCGTGNDGPCCSINVPRPLTPLCGALYNTNKWDDRDGAERIVTTAAVVARPVTEVARPRTCN